MADNKPFDTRSSEWIGDMTVWKRLTDPTNEEQMSRLKRNLQFAMEEELTPRQREMMVMNVFQNKNVSEIASELNINVSTVSRTLTRAKKRLQRALRYSF